MVLDHVDVISALWKPAGGSRSPSRTCDPRPRPDHSRHALKVTKTRRDGRLLLMMTQTRNELSVSGTYCNLSESTVRLRYSRPAGRESPECDEVQVLRFAAMIRTRNSRKCCRRRVRSVNEQQVASVQCSRATVSQCLSFGSALWQERLQFSKGSSALQSANHRSILAAYFVGNCTHRLSRAQRSAANHSLAYACTSDRKTATFAS
jgi:hypothetical protein